jgi:hypothetical protein
MTTREDLADWIDGQIRAPENPAVRLALARVNGIGGETHPLMQIACSDTDSAEVLAGRIHERAVLAARSLHSEGIAFVVQSHSAAGAREAFHFRVGTESSDDLVTAPAGSIVAHTPPSSNPAAALGATITNVHGQVLRHQEVMFRLTMQGMAQSQKALLDQNRQVQEQNQTLLRKHQQLLVLIEKLHDRSSERELSIRSQELSERRKDEILRMLTPVVPILVSRVVRAAGLDAGSDGGEGLMVAQMLKGLFSTLDQTQLAQMIAPLRPEQAAVVVEILKKFSGEESGRQASIDRAVSEQIRRQAASRNGEEARPCP